MLSSRRIAEADFHGFSGVQMAPGPPMQPCRRTSTSLRGAIALGLAMNVSDQQDPTYPEEKTKRVMARVALRKISALVSSWQIEERQNAIYARRILVAISALIALWLLVGAAGFIANATHPKVQLFFVSLAVGVLVGIAAVLWGRRGRK